MAGGSPALEAAALGCPGIHLSVDLAPYGLKLGVFGAPQAWGIRSNAAYAAVLYSYQWAAVDHADAAVLAWARTRAWPFLSAVADFWACFAKKTAVAGAPDVQAALVALVQAEGAPPGEAAARFVKAVDAMPFVVREGLVLRLR